MFLNIFLLVFALCLDTFVASAAYGTNQVHLSAGQIAVINGICSLCLGVSLKSKTKVIPVIFNNKKGCKPYKDSQPLVYTKVLTA